MNTFFVPQLGSMIYTMNRMVTQLNLQADHPGSYFGESGMFSGDGFSDMDFTVQAVSPDAFTGWVQATQQQGTALDAAAYGKLAQQSQNVKPFTFRSVEPNLFQAIVTQKLSPAAAVWRSIPEGASRHAGQTHLGSHSVRPADSADRRRRRRGDPAGHHHLGHHQGPPAVSLA
jgi:cytochrome o ubiquinol oxidase subunit 2